MTRSRKRRATCRLLASCRLLLAIWITYGLSGAPLPVMHEHGGRISGSAWVGSLGEHLERFHAGDGAQSWLGWHVHWVPASDWSGGEDSPADAPPHAASSGDELLLISAPPAPLLSGLTSGAAIWHGAAVAAVCPAEQLVVAPRAALTPRQFFELASPALSSRALFSVARC